MRKKFVFTFRQQYVSNGIRFTLSRRISADSLCEAAASWAHRPEVQSLENNEGNTLLELTVIRERT